MEHKEVCVIGAGVSGLIISKYLKQYQIDFDCFEKRPDFGGLWNEQNERIYDTLHINTTKGSTELEDYPMPKNYPLFPSHQQMFDYICQYVSDFQLKENILFNTTVTQIESINNTFQVQLDNGERLMYQHIIVATGHHEKLQIPDKIVNNFKGDLIHSSQYRNSTPFENKKVLVVGIGNSGVDIACDLAKNTKVNVEISTRNSAYIYPHVVFGKPLGELSNNTPLPIPKFLKRWIGHIVLRLSTGDQQKLGIPKPTYKLLDHHSTVSTDIFHLLRKGRIKFRPGIKEIKNKDVVFNDDNISAYDSIILATGFKISLPFLSSSLIDNFQIENTNQLHLYKRIVLPNHPNLMFVGFVQPNSSVFKTVEEQAKWIIALLKNKFQLPNLQIMQEEIFQHTQYIEKNFYSSPRHTIQVDLAKYMKSLRKDYKN